MIIGLVGFNSNPIGLELLNYLNKYGNVVNGFVSRGYRDEWTGRELDDLELYQRNVANFGRCDIIFGDLSSNSEDARFGVTFVESEHKPHLFLYNNMFRRDFIINRKFGVNIKKYNSLEQAIKHIENFMNGSVIIL